MSTEINVTTLTESVAEAKVTIQSLQEELYMYNRKLEIHFERMADKLILPEVRDFFSSRGIITQEISHHYEQMDYSTILVRLTHAGDWDRLFMDNLIVELEDNLMAIETPQHEYRLVIK